MTSAIGGSVTAAANPTGRGNGREPAGDDAVWCSNVTMTYGRTTAVDDASLSVKRGEILGLLGPNGAGKTTLIRALTTILPVDSGKARVAGYDIGNPNQVRTRIGVVPESSGYPLGQTAEDYVTYHGQLYGLPRAQAQVKGRQLLDSVGLAHHHGSKIKSFSRGMRQRLGIARALINDPEVLFLDEPTLGLDPAGKEEILAEIQHVARESEASVVITTHLLDEVERICDSAVIMNNGRVVASGPVDEMVQIAGIARTVNVRVSRSAIEKALQAFRALEGVSSANEIEAQPGTVKIEFSGGSETGSNEVLRAAIEADIPVISFDQEGATLNDAFLALTGNGGEVRKHGSS